MEVSDISQNVFVINS